eukprot:m.714958 g.714958  ORF g.714958 m.714958 type:complete len:258 (-) comp22974_c0_seq18:841-1614(-)
MGKVARRKPAVSRAEAGNAAEPPETPRSIWNSVRTVGITTLLVVGAVVLWNESKDPVRTHTQIRRTAGSFSADTVDENDDLRPDPLDILAAKFNVTMLSEDPPIYQFDDFLSSRECSGLIKLGRKELEPSTTWQFRDVAPERTSSTGWLIKPYHERSKIIRNVEQRMAEVMNVPRENQEGFQTLEYKPGQYYRTHHDFIIEQEDWASGVRLATFYLYLNDVEEGKKVVTNLRLETLPQDATTGFSNHHVWPSAANNH